ncbi:hypothetical protein CQW23_16983 [Capsicum baccatum]|uniref:Uncharacterized protein n=1 Tax=Capsicum baccatum TaxID=33114 RepID=A0A2G2WCK5_CAPBA|nr:hypothetical protein CQW23_16983 [Capsicum baccatum]
MLLWEKLGISDRQRSFSLGGLLVTLLMIRIGVVGGDYDGALLRTQASCRTDHAGLIDGDPWIKVSYPFQYGAPSCDACEAFDFEKKAISHCGQDQNSYWCPAEASLYCIRAIYDYVSDMEAEGMPQIMSLLSKFPHLP